MSKLQPIAFMSYARFNDEHDYGRLTLFRERLSAEIEVQTGEEFPIFYDRKDILWGQNWKERIEDSIDEVTFLIPILTPSFFKSSQCREEVERFIEREKKLGRTDLILPVYYVGCPILDDEAQRTTDELAQVIAGRQYADWRELRFEPFTSPEVGKTLAKLAIQIRDALERTRPPKKPSKPSTSKRRAHMGILATESLPVTQEIALGGEETGIASRPSAKTQPAILVVDPMHRGDYPTINEAIKAAKPGTRILVKPGLYEEGLVIDKPLEIIGEGAPGEVVVQALGKDALLFKTTMGRVVNLNMQQLGGGDWYCIDIAQGRLEVEGCDITSQSLACVAIHGGADPRLRRNHIHEGKQGGVFVYENGQGTLEDNDIFGNATAGVSIMRGGNPTLRRNRIHEGKQGGVFVYENGQGTLEDNDIFGNAYTGVEIKTGGNTMLRRNRINKNSHEAVLVYDGGGGTIEDNDLRDNAKGAWNVSVDSEPKLKRARNIE
jgi:parallel beta-helix repeat protein